MKLRRIIQALVTTLGIFLLSFLISPSAHAQFNGDLGGISGTVLWGSDVSTQEIVSVQSVSDPTLVINTQADEQNGSYQTGLALPAGDYTVTAKIGQNGELTVGSQTVSVTAGSTATANFDAQSVSGLVKGRVTVNGTDAQGQVTFCDSSNACQTISVTGSFALALAGGSYTVSAQTTGEATVDLGSIPITVTNGQITDNVAFNTTLGGISGTVTWGSEVSTQEIVSVQSVSDPTFVLNTQVNEQDGTYATAVSLVPGDYTVTAKIGQNGELVVGTQTVTVAGGATATANFDAQSVSGLVKGGVTVNGTDAQGQVTFCDSSNACQTISVTGSFALALAGGSYTVSAHTTGAVTIDLGSIPITVTNGQITDNVAFNTTLGGISGTVTWGSDVSSQGVVSVQSVSDPSLLINVPVSEQDGTYNTDLALPAGDYTVTAKIGQNGELTVGSQTVTVTGGSTATASFDAQSVSGLVKGRLTANGADTKGQVTFCDSSNACQTIYVFGSFALALTGGSYTVDAQVTGEVSIDLGTIPITVTNGQIFDLVTSTTAVDTGSNVNATIGDVSLTFNSVDTSGYVNVSTTTTPLGGTPPSQINFLDNYYQISPTITYTSPITISIAYDPATVTGSESDLKLFHWDGTTWQDVTTSVDTINHIITGVTPSLSPFTLGLPKPVTCTWQGVQQPINADGSSVFKQSSTISVKTMLSGSCAGQTDAILSLYVAKVNDNTAGTVNEASSTSAADSGNTFRYDASSGQYVFNLGTKSLAAGEYQLLVYYGGTNTTGSLLGTVNISLK